MNILLPTHRDRLFATGQVYLNEYNSTREASELARLHKTRGSIEAATLMQCIAHGVTECGQLVRTAARICGSSERMVWNILLENRGGDPEQHLWFEKMTIPYARQFVLHEETLLMGAVQ